VFVVSFCYRRGVLCGLFGYKGSVRCVITMFKRLVNVFIESCRIPCNHQGN
jgi:hypothetical protein